MKKATTEILPLPLPDPGTLEAAASSAQAQLAAAFAGARSRLRDVGTDIEAEVAQLRALVHPHPPFGVTPIRYILQQGRLDVQAALRFEAALDEAERVAAAQQEAVERLDGEIARAEADPETPAVILERLVEHRRAVGRAVLARLELHAAVEHAARFRAAFHAAAGRRRAAVAQLAPELIAEAAGRATERAQAIIEQVRREAAGHEQELAGFVAESESAFEPLSPSALIWPKDLLAPPRLSADG